MKALEEGSETSTQIASSWNSGHEELLASIADRANGSSWMHTKCQRWFERWSFWLTVPSVVMSTLAGSATIGLNGLFEESQQKSATVVIGLMTLSCTVFTSINQFMKTSQYAEAHRAAALAYGKLHRTIQSELTLRRDQRVNATDFLKTVRAEQDRLQEISPDILDHIVSLFNRVFKDRHDLEKPEIVGDLDHVVVNKSVKHASFGRERDLDEPVSPPKKSGFGESDSASDKVPSESDKVSSSVAVPETPQMFARKSSLSDNATVDVDITPAR